MSTEPDRHAESVRAYQTDDGVWVVSENGVWLPGVYESETVARQAASLSNAVLVDLERIYRIDGENRPVTADDLLLIDGLEGGSDA